MNIVQPIRDPEVIEMIKEDLRRTNERNYILFVLGINTGLRIYDILKLKVGDLKGGYISLREKKTNKQKLFKITPDLKRELSWYLKDKDDDEYLVKSRQGVNRPITRNMAYKILRQIGKDYNQIDIGCHSLRKTYGYHFYKQTKNIALLMDLFNHSTEKTTLRYIGANQDEMDKAMMRFKI